MEFSGAFSTCDRVCHVWYRSHLITLKHIKQSVESTDSDLQDNNNNNYNNNNNISFAVTMRYMECGQDV